MRIAVTVQPRVALGLVERLQLGPHGRSLLLRAAPCEVPGTRDDAIPKVGRVEVEAEGGLAGLNKRKRAAGIEPA